MGAFTPPLKKQTKTNHEQKKAYRDDKLFLKLKYSDYLTKLKFHVSTTTYLIVIFSLL